MSSMRLLGVEIVVKDGRHFGNGVDLGFRANENPDAQEIADQVTGMLRNGRIVSDWEKPMLERYGV